LEEKSSGSSPEIENTAAEIRHAGHVAPLYLKKLALTPPTIGSRSVDIIRSRTQTMEFVFVFDGNN
jgi:hypothetical protein